MSALDRLRGVRLTNPGFLLDRNTDYRVAEDGRIMEVGAFLEQPTGYRIAEDGAIMKAGTLFDEPTGYRIDEEGEIFELGFLLDTRANLRVGTDGSLHKREWLGERRVDWPNSLDQDTRDAGTDVQVRHGDSEAQDVAPEREAETSHSSSDEPSISLARQRDFERDQYVRFARRTLGAAKTKDGFDCRRFRDILRQPGIFDERHRLIWSARHFGAGLEGPSLDTKEVDELRAAVVEQYKEWSAKIGAQFAADIAGARKLAPFPYLLQIVAGAFFLFMIGPSGWFASLIKAAFAGAICSFVFGRISSLVGGNEWIQREREVLVDVLKVSHDEACRLVPNDLSWIWNFFPKDDLEAGKKLSDVNSGFRYILQEYKKS